MICTLLQEFLDFESRFREFLCLFLMESGLEDGIVEDRADCLPVRSVADHGIEHADGLVGSVEGGSDGMSSGLHGAHDGSHGLTPIGLVGHDEYPKDMLERILHKGRRPRLSMGWVCVRWGRYTGGDVLCEGVAPV